MVGSRSVEKTVCETCKRPHSPALNMIVFCDGCGKAWHRYCHHPPIPQDVVEVAEMEWYCRACMVERGERVGQVNVDTFVSAQGRLTAAEVSQYQSSSPINGTCSIGLQYCNADCSPHRNAKP